MQTGGWGGKNLTAVFSLLLLPSRPFPPLPSHFPPTPLNTLELNVLLSPVQGRAQRCGSEFAALEKERMEEGEIEGRKEASESHMQKTTKHKSKWDFPENPVVKTPYFHCRGHSLSPWLGN